MNTSPRSLRTHIGLFGRRNVGKSSVLNALTRQQVAIVSATPGTTTDPVEKPMEFLPLGPVLFVDTAGLDDEGALGVQRIAKTRKALERTDLALLVAEAGSWGPFEEELLAEVRARSIPVVVVLNKADAGNVDAALADRLAGLGVPAVETVATSGEGIPRLREALLAVAPAEAVEPASPLALDAIGTALDFLGTPYRNGGSDPSGFDCSGFVQYVYSRIGIALPRSVGRQLGAGRDVTGERLRAGDLLFFSTTGPGATHVGIALGDGRFVHAPSSRGTVRVESVGGGYWGPRIVGVRCVIEP